MKRLLSVVLALILSLSLFSFPLKAETDEASPAIDTTLLAQLKLFLAGINETIIGCDFNSDNAVNTLDLSILKLKLAGNEEIIPMLNFTKNGYIIEEKAGVTYIDGILVVNKTYGLPQDYAPEKIVDECQKAFDEMKKGAKEDGISIWISSGYRSYGTQKTLYDNYCKSDGVLNADTYSARPGYSEHQTGLAIDVNKASSAAYQTTYKKVGEWLEENCWDYGFIIRYPKGKEHITGYIHEPWHVRYVGKEYARKIKESGLCLEEYFGIESKYA